MADPFIGEIRLFGFPRVPDGWFACNGQSVSIAQFETLYAVIGTTYGGDGQSTFALPDLRGRVPLHQGDSFILAENGGAEEVNLTTQQIPSHTHAFVATLNNAGASTPTGNVTGQVGASQIYREAPADTPMSPQTAGQTGGSQPHTNFQPYLCINFIISLFGIFPSPT